MKRLFLSLLVLLGIGVLAVIALPWLISSDTVRANLLARANEVTGREMRFNGDPKVSFSPFLGIEIQDVVFAQKNASQDEQPLLSMPYLRAKLNLASALTGEVVIDEFQFIQPKFNLKLFASGNTSWTFPDGEVWRSLQEAKNLKVETPTGTQPDLQKLSNLRLGRFSVESGTIEYTNEISGRKETITNFNGSLLWPNIRAGWTFSGNGIWRGDGVNVDLTAATPVMLLAGGSSKLKATVRSDTVNLDFDGEANRFSDLFYSGAATASAPSLRKMIEFFGGEAGVGSSFLEFSANGNLSGTLSDMKIENATLKLDGNDYVGGLRLILIEQSPNQLSGTLATELLRLAPYTSGMLGPEGLSSTLKLLNQTQLDLRLSAKSVAIGEFSLNDFAGGLSSKDQVFKIDIGNAALGAGLIVGNIQMAQKESDVEASVSLDAASLNLNEVTPLKALSGIIPSGPSDVKLRMSATAGDFDNLKNQMNGNFSIAMKNGNLNGLNFAEIKSSINDSGEESANIQIGNSPLQTKISDFVLNSIITHGVGWIQNSGFVVDGYNAQLTGKADLRSGNLGIWGVLQDVDEALSMEGFQFFLGGTMEQPLYVPEPNLIRPDLGAKTGQATEPIKDTGQSKKTN
ncbi:MAG: AsmA family protein [Salaquimonas sp.]